MNPRSGVLRGCILGSFLGAAMLCGVCNGAEAAPGARFEPVVPPPANALETPVPEGEKVAISKEKAIETAIASMQFTQKPPEPKTELVYSTRGLRDEWRVEYPQAVVTVSAADGSIVGFVLKDEEGDKANMTRTKADAIPMQIARRRAGALLARVNSRADLYTTEGKYVSGEGIKKGESHGPVWMFSQPQRRGDVMCYDSDVTVLVRAGDGQAVSFDCGYAPDDVSLKTEVTQEEAAKSVEAVAPNGMKLGHAELRIVNPLMQGIPSPEKKAGLFWVIEAGKGANGKTVTWFVDAHSGKVYVENEGNAGTPGSLMKFN